MEDGKLSFCFDGMYVVIGFYVKCIFSELLGVFVGNFLNCVVKEDFGGGYLDFNWVYVKIFYEYMMFDYVMDLGVVFDGDGDCNMILGNGVFVSFSDSLVLIVEYY